MKDCVRFAPMLGAREGELTAGEAKALEAHLSGCASCRAIAASFTAMDGLAGEALLRRANERDFAPFVDEVMAKVGARAPAEPALTFWQWIAGHRRTVAATLAPVLAAAAVLVYVQTNVGGPTEVALLEVASIGEATTILQTQDGPVVLIASEEDGT